MPYSAAELQRMASQRPDEGSHAPGATRLLILPADVELTALPTQHMLGNGSPVTFSFQVKDPSPPSHPGCQLVTRRCVVVATPGSKRVCA